MIRVLHVLGGLGSGGAENLIMNWYRAIDRSKIQFDFLVRSDDNNFVDEIHELGGSIYYTSPFPRHAIRNYQETDALLKTGKWDVVHVHGNAALYMTALVLAKKYRVPCRIMHSHSIQAKRSFFSIIHVFNRTRLKRYTTEQIACSADAGKWMFGKTSFHVLKNAINVNSFSFSMIDRRSAREEFCLSNRFVVGHVGRFAEPKNHSFLLEIFKQIRKTRTDATLLLVGDGELEEQVKRKALEMGLEDAIVFAGRRNDVGRLMSAMDVFVFPSLWEGLGIVLVEAQTNGLPCFASREILTEEVRITPDIYPISLEQTAEHWARQILTHHFDISNRGSVKRLIEQSGYDISSVAAALEHIYENGVRGHV